MNLFSDMDSNQFQFTLWTMIVTGFIIVVSIFSYTAVREDDLIAGLIREGHDPLELTCLYKRSDNIAPACLLLIERRTHE